VWSLENTPPSDAEASEEDTPPPYSDEETEDSDEMHSTAAACDTLSRISKLSMQEKLSSTTVISTPKVLIRVNILKKTCSDAYGSLTLQVPSDATINDFKEAVYKKLSLKVPTGKVLPSEVSDLQLLLEKSGPLIEASDGVIVWAIEKMRSVSDSSVSGVAKYQCFLLDPFISTKAGYCPKLDDEFEHVLIRQQSICQASATSNESWKSKKSERDVKRSKIEAVAELWGCSKKSS
jgi:hypothetical protein